MGVARVQLLPLWTIEFVPAFASMLLIVRRTTLFAVPVIASPLLAVRRTI